jgi:hypothetical protein
MLAVCRSELLEVACRAGRQYSAGRLSGDDELLGQRAFVSCRLGACEQRRAITLEEPGDRGVHGI